MLLLTIGTCHATMIGSSVVGTKRRRPIGNCRANHRRRAGRAVLSCTFETVSHIRLTDFGEGDDHLLLCGIHHRHLAICGHALFMWRGLLSRDFRGVPVAMLTFFELCAMR